MNWTVLIGDEYIGANLNEGYTEFTHRVVARYTAGRRSQNLKPRRKAATATAPPV